MHISSTSTILFLSASPNHPFSFSTSLFPAQSCRPPLQPFHVPVKASVEIPQRSPEEKIQRLQRAIAIERRGGYANVTISKKHGSRFDQALQEWILDCSFGQPSQELTSQILTSLEWYGKMSKEERKDWVTNVLKWFVACANKRRGKMKEFERYMKYKQWRNYGEFPNWWWRAVPWEALWSHDMYERLPSFQAFSVQTPADFRLMRKRSMPWKEVKRRSAVTADMVWKVLGLGSDVGGVALNGSPNGWISRITAWKQMLSPKRYADEYPLTGKELANEKFAAAHEPNCIVTYLDWENGAFSKTPRRRCTRLREMGLCILEPNHLLDSYGVHYDSLPVISASPDAVVLRRSTRYGWNGVPNTIFIAQCQVPFVQVSKDRWDFHRVMPKTCINSLDYAQAQFEMLCSGLHIRRCRLSSYSVLEGTTCFEIERDDRWLEIALKHVRDFYHDFVLTRIPPPSDAFAYLDEHAELLDLTKMGVIGSRRVGLVPGSKDIFFPVIEDEELRSKQLSLFLFPNLHLGSATSQAVRSRSVGNRRESISSIPTCATR